MSTEMVNDDGWDEGEQVVETEAADGWEDAEPEVPLAMEETPVSDVKLFTKWWVLAERVQFSQILGARTRQGSGVLKTVKHVRQMLYIEGEAGMRLAGHGTKLLDKRSHREVL